MRKKLLLAATAALVLVVPPLALRAAQQSATTYSRIDTAHSNVGFAVPILGGLAKVRGKFTDFSVEIVHDQADVTKSSVKAVIKAASIDTGIEQRDAHLRNADFFDVEKFPEITFESKRIEKRGDGFVAHGSFTMHGVTKEIALPFRINGVQKTPNGGSVLGASARLIIDRRDYGITFARRDNPDFLGNNVELELDLVTRVAGGTPPPPRPSPQPQASPTPAKP